MGIPSATGEHGRLEAFQVQGKNQTNFEAFYVPVRHYKIVSEEWSKTKIVLLSNFLNTFAPSGQLKPTWIALLRSIANIPITAEAMQQGLAKFKQRIGSNSIAGMLAKWGNRFHQLQLSRRILRSRLTHVARILFCKKPLEPQILGRP